MTTISLPELQSQVRGRVIGPTDEGYDGARTIMLGGCDPPSDPKSSKQAALTSTPTQTP